MIQHKYKGENILAAYGHVVEIDPNLNVGDTVKKGQYLDLERWWEPGEMRAALFRCLSSL